MISKKQMTEEDIKLQYITPALTEKWDRKKITMETQITDWYFRTDDERKCVPTEYARKNGANTAEEYLSDGGENDEYYENYYLDGRATCWWWLRSTGEYRSQYVTRWGGVSNIGSYVNYDEFAIRPAIWVDIKS